VRGPAEPERPRQSLVRRGRYPVSVRYQRPRCCFLALALLCLLCLSALAPSASADGSCFGAGPDRTFSDGFASSASLSPWTALTGNFDPGQLQSYTPSAFSVEGGHLDILANHLTPQGYSSGRISTQNSCNLLYGNVQARIWIPPGRGLWPAFWLEDQGDQHEIDIMENLGQNSSLYDSGVHTDTLWDVHSENTSVTGRWRTYGIEWTSGQVIFTLGRRAVCWRPDAVDSPMFLVLNLAIGGWAGPPDLFTPFPAVMMVDWVRVRPINPSAGPPPGLKLCQVLPH
jgi:beta-glucanase (GH16 family)